MPLAFAALTFDALEKTALFLLMLSVLVVLHEAGHFALARRNGVRVNDFAVGFGPTLLKWRSPRSGTNYRINLLPLGGYCAMQGEDGKTSEAEQQRQFRSEGDAPHAVDNFQAKTPLQRLSIVVAGPIANFILAFVILFVGALAFGVPSAITSTTVGPLKDGYPAQKAGLHLGDQIVTVDGVKYADGGTMIKKIHASTGRKLHFEYRRHGAQAAVDLIPIAGDDGHGHTVGLIGFVPIATYARLGPLDAATSAATAVWNGIAGNLTGLAALVSHPMQQASAMSGPIGMGRAAAAYQDLGWGPYMQLAAAISIALGIFNLLPVPALDGGRAIFIVAEMLRGRPVDAEKEAIVHFTGFAVLMALMAFVAFHDIANIVSGKGIF